jgi:hypothetical protein
MAKIRFWGGALDFATGKLGFVSEEGDVKYHYDGLGSAGSAAVFGGRTGTH